MPYRVEHDTMGDVLVPEEKLWGAQTQRSFENFRIGTEKMPVELIEEVCDEILDGKLAGEFPLAVWQTGSGTQTNMNLNEVIANRGNLICGEKLLHPNDHVNMSQSSNDTFPSALNIAALRALHSRLFPAIDGMILALARIERDNPDVVKTGRTHLQDAVPIRFCQEVSGWRGMLENARSLIKASVPNLGRIALGATAVGTGLNAPKGFDEAAAEEIRKLTGLPVAASENKFHALTALDSVAASHGAIRALAANLMKIANDVRHLASGPRCGLGEITIPANEP